MSHSRFGNEENKAIDRLIEENIPKNTVRSKKYIWKLFMDFCIHDLTYY